MKNILLATAFTLSTTSVFAGGLNEPVYEPTVVPPTIVAEAAADSSSDLWAGVLLTFLTIVVIGVGG